MGWVYSDVSSSVEVCGFVCGANPRAVQRIYEQDNPSCSRDNEFWWDKEATSYCNDDG